MQHPVAAEVLRQPIHRPLTLRLEGAKHPIPHDEGAAVILVEVARVAAVVHAVVAGRVEHRLEPARQLADHLGVQPELIPAAQQLRRQQHLERHPEQRQRDEEARQQRRGPALAQRHREVVAPRRVVRLVDRPADPDLVAEAVRPVQAEVEHHHRHQPGHPVVGRQAQRAQLVQRVQGPRHARLARRPDHQRPRAAAQVGPRVGPVVRIHQTAPPRRPPLEQHQRAKPRDDVHHRVVGEHGQDRGQGVHGSGVP